MILQPVYLFLFCDQQLACLCLNQGQDVDLVVEDIPLLPHNIGDVNRATQLFDLLLQLLDFKLFFVESESEHLIYFEQCHGIDVTFYELLGGRLHMLEHLQMVNVPDRFECFCDNGISGVGSLGYLLQPQLDTVVFAAVLAGAPELTRAGRAPSSNFVVCVFFFDRQEAAQLTLR